MINARKKGNAFELAVIAELKTIYGDDIHSTRNTNRKLDGEKVDIQGAELPWNIQCKATENLPQVHKIFDEINRDKPPVIWWKKNHKRQVVILEAETFLELLLAIVDKKE